MKAVILAAGIASRLRPLTENTPKCLLKISGKTILERTINALINNCIKEFIVVTGYLQEQIKDFLISRYEDYKFTFIYNDVYDSTNNIYSLWLTKEMADGEDFLLLDSDILFEEKIIGRLLSSDYSNCLAMRDEGEVGDEEIKLLLNADYSIAEISKEVIPAEAAGESIGIEKFCANFSTGLFQLLDEMIIEEKMVNIFYEAAFQRLINSGKHIFAVSVGSLKCMELDTVEDFREAEKIF